MDLSKPIIACDASYFVFYRYYAVKGWYKRACEHDLDVQNALSDNVFVEKYDYTFEKTINDLTKRYKVPHSNLVFAKDCARDKIWRNSLYPPYKSNRDEKTSSFNCDIFKHTYNDLVPRLQEKYGFHYILHANLEADDVIALMVARIRELSRKVRIIVITNDNDYVQLYKYPNVDIYNLQNKSLKDRVEDVENYLLYKIIVGDKSDNIKSIGKKIGDKTAKKMISDSATMQRMLATDEVRANFELNKKLIDFTYIPEQYKTELFLDLKRIIT